MSNEQIPTEFTGLLYAPSSENEVYILMALLLPYLPSRIVFEEFEVDPKRQGYQHAKWLDARGKKLVDGEWKDITIEFKLYSSGFLGDIERYPELKTDRVNLLICWVDDAPEVSEYVDEVIALKPIFFKLPERERKRMILYPHKTSKVTLESPSMEDLVSRFTEANRSKVKRLLDLWLDETQSEAQPGTAEILFRHGGRTVLRACAYAVDHVIVTDYVSERGRSAILSRFNGQQLTTNQISIPLANIDISDSAEFINLILGTPDQTS